MPIEEILEKLSSKEVGLLVGCLEGDLLGRRVGLLDGWSDSDGTEDGL